MGTASGCVTTVSLVVYSVIDILLRVRGGILSGGDFRFAVPPTPSTVRIRIGVMDCGGCDCWECQAPGTPILHRVRTPGVVFASGSPAEFTGLGVTFCGAFKQSGTASVHCRNRSFT